MFVFKINTFLIVNEKTKVFLFYFCILFFKIKKNTKFETLCNMLSNIIIFLVVIFFNWIFIYCVFNNIKKLDKKLESMTFLLLPSYSDHEIKNYFE
jgi:hypothetical protein